MSSGKRQAVAALAVVVGLMLCYGYFTTAGRKSASTSSAQVVGKGLPPESVLGSYGADGDGGRVPIERDVTSVFLTGRVSDAQTALPVPHALVSVMIAGTDIVETSAGEKGDYQLSYSGGQGVLRASASGYLDAEMRVGPGLGSYDLALTPSHETEVFVVWKGGSRVPNAKVSLVTQIPKAVDDESPSSDRVAFLGESDSNGRILVSLSRSSQLTAVDARSGCFGSSVAYPGRQCQIVIDPQGADLVFRAPNDAPLTGLQYSLRYSGEGGNDILPALGGDPGLKLRPGTWVLRIVDGPFALGGVYRDQDFVGSSPDNLAAFSVLESTSKIEVELTSGPGIHLTASGAPIEGPFTYRLRRRWKDGIWRDSYAYRGAADRSGNAQLYAIFSDPSPSLRIDVAGYDSVVVSQSELVAGIRDAKRIEIELSPSSSTYFRLQYANGVPYAGFLLVDAEKDGSLRELYVGRADATGAIPVTSLLASESIRFADWNRVTLASVGASAVRLGQVNVVTLDSIPCEILIQGVPSRAPRLAVIGAKGDRYSLSRVGDRLFSPPLSAGKYYVGPPDIAEACRLFAGGFGAAVESNRSRVLQIVLEQGQECSIPWVESWILSETRGRITIAGSVTDVVVVPVYSGEGLPVRLGPSVPMFRLEANGTYQIPAEFFPPDLLAVCSLDAFSSPVPLDFVRPGENAIVYACSLKLRWSRPVTSQETGFVSFAIATSGFSFPIQLPSNEYAAVWGLRNPLEITGIPCGKTKVWVRVGTDVTSKETSISFDSSSVLEF